MRAVQITRFGSPAARQRSPEVAQIRAMSWRPAATLSRFRAAKTAHARYRSRWGNSMAELSARAVRRCLAFAELLLDVQDFRGIEDVLLGELAELLHSDLAIYHQIDRRVGEEVSVGWPRSTYRAEHLTGYAELMTWHPVVTYALAGPLSPQPVRTSDWLSRRQWHANPLYQDCYRHLGLDDQIAVAAVDRGGTFDGISLGRAGRNYRDEERDVLFLVMPHVRAALRRAEAAPGEIPALRVAPTLEATPLGGGRSADQFAHEAGLTPREAEVLCLVARGFTDQQAAHRLGLGVRTVGKHLEHIYAKLGVTDRQAAVHAARSSPRPRGAPR
jgi:DNA-binding CsgD family transcriptional regulator